MDEVNKPKKHGGWREEARGKTGPKPNPDKRKIRIGTLFLLPDDAEWLKRQQEEGETLIQTAERLIRTLRSR